MPSTGTAREDSWGPEWNCIARSWMRSLTTRLKKVLTRRPGSSRCGVRGRDRQRTRRIVAALYRLGPERLCRHGMEASRLERRLVQQVRRLLDVSCAAYGT